MQLALDVNTYRAPEDPWGKIPSMSPAFRALARAVSPQRIKPDLCQRANQRSEQQGMVLVHMGTRPARAQLICMARA